MTGNLTERRLAATFRKSISNPRTVVDRQKIRYVVPELVSREGIADFVVSPTRLESIPADVLNKFRIAIRTKSAALLVSLLSGGEGRTREDLVRISGLSESVVRRYLKQLKTAGVVTNGAASAYLISPLIARYFPRPGIKLWAYELKLTDWTHAFRQALRYRSFAHQASIVIPKDYVHRLMPQKARFRSFKVGIVALDRDAASLRTIVRAPEEEPFSESDHLFAIAAFLRRVDGTQSRIQHR